MSVCQEDRGTWEGTVCPAPEEHGGAGQAGPVWGPQGPARAPHGKVRLGASAARGAEAVRAKMQAKDDPRTWPEPLEDRGASESGVGSREGQAGQGGAEVQGREAGAELCRDTFWRGWGLSPLAPGSRASFLRAARTATSVLMEPEKPARLCACVSL